MPGFGEPSFLLLNCLFIKAGVECIKVFAVKPVGRKTKRLAETLIMHNLAFA